MERPRKNTTALCISVETLLLGDDLAQMIVAKAFPRRPPETLGTSRVQSETVCSQEDIIEQLLQPRYPQQGKKKRRCRRKRGRKRTRRNRHLVETPKWETDVWKKSVWETSVWKKSFKKNTRKKNMRKTAAKKRWRDK